MYPDGAISLLDLTEQVDGVAHVDDIVIGEGHNLWQYLGLRKECVLSRVSK